MCCYALFLFFFCFFFFQAEDGIRDHCVTGVQTCALPISSTTRGCCAACRVFPSPGSTTRIRPARPKWRSSSTRRSEERRVGKECRSRWAAEHEKKKKLERNREIRSRTQRGGIQSQWALSA